MNRKRLATLGLILPPRRLFQCAISPFPIMALCLGVALSACTTTGLTDRIVPSENQNSRISSVVIHYTSQNFEEALDTLTKKSSRPVSSHYLVPSPEDITYRGKKLEVYSLVDETARAWHAGRSYWDGRSGLNDQSIGIEIVNETYCKTPETGSGEIGESKTDQTRVCFYEDYPDTQMVVLVDLLRDILKRYPDIKPTHIVGHSDIAPDRKIDPGPRFQWQLLYQYGIGAWFDDETVVKYWSRFKTRPPTTAQLQKALAAYGYKIEATGALDAQTQNVLRAFQLHFRAMNVTGQPDLDSTAILFALLEKYHPERLSKILPGA